CAMRMPRHVVPMLARLSTMPEDEDAYGFEIKWDGIRALVYSGAREREITIENRNLRDITFKYPELHGLAGLNAVIDGEIVAREQALEGVMAKKLDSPYSTGKRTPYWLKIKAKQRQEFVIGGWLPGEGRRESTLGALVVGYHDDGGALRYAGRVGTGFKERDL